MEARGTSCCRDTVLFVHLRQCRDLQQRVSAELQLEEYLLRAQNGELYVQGPSVMLAYRTELL